MMDSIRDFIDVASLILMRMIGFIAAGEWRVSLNRSKVDRNTMTYRKDGTVNRKF